MSDNRYYISSFAWTTATKVINAIVGFISVPILLGIYGKAEYGLLGLATACNGYMHLLDLGLNTGAVRWYSIWLKNGDRGKMNRVSRSNLTFYSLVAAVNALILCIIAIAGEKWFNVTPEQFTTLRACLFILAAFSIFNWSTTAFSQILVADKQMVFTMKIQLVQALLKGLLIVLVVFCRIPLTLYFALLTAILAGLVIPYAIKVRRDRLVDSFRPGWFWDDFKPVLLFSLSIFALSVFQISATESRAIILGICGESAGDIVADFKVLSVVPSLIITIGTSFVAIFLPRTSQMMERNDSAEISRFSYKWTGWTTIIADVLCFPFMLCAGEVLTAYVGESFSGLAGWLVLWCITALVQIHTTPTNSLVIASGKLKALVSVTAAACIISIIINALCCKHLGAGSAVLGYFIYVLIVIGLYYLYYYKSLLSLDRWKMFMKFLIPTLLACVAMIPVHLAGITTDLFPRIGIRAACILVCLLKTAAWLVPYAVLLFAFRVLKIEDIKEMKKR